MRDAMKDLGMLTWLTQLGISVALPLIGFVGLAVWLHTRYQWGLWVVFCGIALGLICAINGFRQSLQAMDRMAKDKPKEGPPPVFYNDHD